MADEICGPLRKCRHSFVRRNLSTWACDRFTSKFLVSCQFNVLTLRFYYVIALYKLPFTYLFTYVLSLKLL